jgi:hypothetical protein
MVKITVPKDCGNAPKKLFVRDFILAIARNDSALVSRNTTDDISWNLVGGQCFGGKQDVLAELQRRRSAQVSQLIIDTIVTHGYDGVADGLIKFKDGKTVAFCDVYQFRASTNNAPIKAIRTYTIALA